MGLKIKQNWLTLNFVLNDILSHSTSYDLIGEMTARIPELIDLISQFFKLPLNTMSFIRFESFIKATQVLLGLYKLNSTLDGPIHTELVSGWQYIIGLSCNKK